MLKNMSMFYHKTCAFFYLSSTTSPLAWKIPPTGNLLVTWATWPMLWSTDVGLGFCEIPSYSQALALPAGTRGDDPVKMYRTKKLKCITQNKLKFTLVLHKTSLWFSWCWSMIVWMLKWSLSVPLGSLTLWACSFLNIAKFQFLHEANRDNYSVKNLHSWLSEMTFPFLCIRKALASQWLISRNLGGNLVYR